MMKLQEEMGEVQHAFNRGQLHQVLDEIQHVRFILNRLTDEILVIGIPDTRGATYGNTAEGG